MIFLLNKIEREKVNKLIDTYLYNNEIADYINKEIINEIPTNEDIKELGIKELKIEDYLEDKYFKNVKLKEVKNANYQIKYEKYKPYQAFLYDDIEVNEDDYFLIKNKIGYFSKAYQYPTIQKDQIIWMGVFPHEINTMKKCKSAISSHIYILGLGLAYFPYSFCSSASKITIIENDPMMIEIFKKHIFPFFENKEKYEIVLADAFTQIKNIKPSDSVFVDLWHNVDDGFLTYLKMKKAFKDHLHVTYWIEDTMLAAFRNILINLINEEINKMQIDYKHIDNEIDELTNKLHKYLENKKFTNYLEIKKLLSKDSLKELIIKV